ncbi:MAG: alpha/beta hydrolase [Nitratireductor sp.]|nr:alpha/beta hydrolase [Nitratireductor sp.]
MTHRADQPKPLKGSYFIHPGGMLHYHRRGKGEPVLLLHGCGSIGEEMLRAFSPWDGADFIAPDRPGYGFSTVFGDEPAGDPREQAQTIAHFLSWLDAAPCTVVAHSLGASLALWLASDNPHLVRNLVLLAPYCRPSREAWAPALRLAAAPVVGRAFRTRAVPALAPWLGRRIIRSVMRPRPVPKSLEDFPYQHAAHESALLAAAAELRSFNASMRELERRPAISQPGIAVFGSHDRTSAHDWHGGWLEARMHALETIVLSRTGHALHHAEPEAISSLVMALAQGNTPPLAPGGILAELTTPLDLPERSARKTRQPGR